MKKRLILLVVLIPTISCAGYGWAKYVDPKFKSLKDQINSLSNRVMELEAKVQSLEKSGEQKRELK